MPVFCLVIAPHQGMIQLIIATTIRSKAAVLGESQRNSLIQSPTFHISENKPLKKALYPKVIFSDSLTALNGQYCFDNVDKIGD